MAGYTVLLDACVLYPAPIRDILIELASANLFRAHWTREIEDEWVRNLLLKRLDLDPDALKRTCELMQIAVQDAIVTDYEELIGGLQLPDPDDRHVLAAAIKSKCDAIVTFNLKDFPAEAVGKYDIEVLHPDEFLFQQFGLDQPAVLIAAQRCRDRLKRYPKTGEEYLDTLEAQALPTFVAELRPYADVI